MFVEIIQSIARENNMDVFRLNYYLDSNSSDDENRRNPLDEHDEDF
jgi:hypothetical protein